MIKKLIHKAAPIFILSFILMSMQSQTGISRYSGTATQASTAAPVPTVHENDFPSNTFTWARTSAGLYTITASRPVFTASKTKVKIFSAAGIISPVITSTTVLTFTTATHAGVAGDDLLTNSSFDIEVQN